MDRRGGGGDAAAIGQAVVVVGSPLLLALAVAGQRDARRSHAAELQALAREREALVGEAVAQERAAMARELHDIAAHHLSGIALMASAIDRQLVSDPEAARDGVRQVRSQSMAVLDDLRRLVGLLRDPAESVEAVQTLDTIPSLLEAARAAGNPVRLDIVPSRVPGEHLGAGVGPLGQLAAYRMVQESLTNAVAHAPAAASTVTLDDSDGDILTVTVETEAPPARPRADAPDGGLGHGGFGILGMRERASLVGGALASGPTPEGGWLTRMELPRDGRPRPTVPTEEADG